ncbi:MAG: SoxAX cytochrome complex subunit precursor, partial [Pseudomonadota bacterium]
MSSVALRLHRGVATLVMAITSISAAASNADVRRTGNDFLSPELRALQSDPTRNPAELWVERGRQLWHGAGAGSDTARSCQHCHADGAAPAAGTGSGPSASEVAR